MTWAESFLVGAGLGISLAAPPGPIFAKVAFEVSRGRHMTGFLVGLGATCADMMFFGLVALGLFQATPPPWILGVLGLGGVVLMDFFAFSAWKSARVPPAPQEEGLSGWVGGFVLAVTSPFNWSWWLLSGVPFVALYGPALGVGFFLAILSWVVLVVALFAWASKRVARFEMYVSYASAVMLFGFGLWLGYNSIQLILD
ncbi:MAG TPA: LysE family transporter [Candidatus Thermoplasmatota archaeon]